MTVKELATHLDSIMLRHPEMADAEMVTPIDPEGNGYYVIDTPLSFGHYQGHGDILFDEWDDEDCGFEDEESPVDRSVYPRVVIISFGYFNKLERF